MPEKSQSYWSPKRLWEQIDPRTFWLIFGVVVLAHLALYLAVTFLNRSVSTVEVKRPFLEYVSADLLDTDLALREQAILLDSAPLFIPTRWNATSRQPLRLGFDSTTDGFQDYLPEFSLLNDLKPFGLSESDPAEVSRPEDLLKPRFLDAYRSVGTSGGEITALEPTTPTAVIRILEAGAWRSAQASVLSLNVDIEVDSGNQILNPASVYIQISGTGDLISGPILNAGSGSNDFDELVISWVQRVDVLARLPAGYLEVEIYP